MKIRDLLLTLFLIAIGGTIGCPVGVAIHKHTIKNEEDKATASVYCDTLSRWELMQLAIIKTESEFNPIAVAGSGAIGIYQMTSIYVKEVNRISGDTAYVHTDAFDPQKANDMFGIYQGYYNPSKDVNKAIYLHNPKGDCIGYSAKVLRNMEEIRKYEAIRQIIKNQ